MLTHVGARWYDVRTGRFIQRDPIGLRAGRNVYRYTTNPVSQSDPSGLMVFGASGEAGVTGPGGKFAGGGQVIIDDSGNVSGDLAGGSCQFGPWGAGVEGMVFVVNADSVDDVDPDREDRVTFEVGGIMCTLIFGDNYMGVGIGAGASVGGEGPSVQVGGQWAEWGGLIITDTREGIWGNRLRDGGFTPGEIAEMGGR